MVLNSYWYNIGTSLGPLGLFWYPETEAGHNSKFSEVLWNTGLSALGLVCICWVYACAGEDDLPDSYFVFYGIAENNPIAKISLKIWACYFRFKTGSVFLIPNISVKTTNVEL